MSSTVQGRPRCGISRAFINPSPVGRRLPSRSTSRLPAIAAKNISGAACLRRGLVCRAESSSGHLRGGSRTARDLQAAENEARGEIVELNSGMDRIANVANSAAEKAASPTAAHRLSASDPSSAANGINQNGSTTSAAARAEPVPPLRKPELPPEGFEQPLAHGNGDSDDRSEQPGKAGSSGGRKGEDVKGAMLKPSSVNSPWVRLLAIAGAVFLASRGTALLSRRSAAFVYVLAYATWTGSNLWTTFVAGITMFKNLPRQVFGRLQAKLFPPYFQLQAGCIGLLLGSLSISATGLPQSQSIVLGAALVSTLLNLVVAEPMATRVMFERYELENANQRDESRIKALYKTFGKWHGISSMLNLVATVCAVAHGWWFAGMIVPV